MTIAKLDKRVARKVLAVVDAGLVKGLGKPVPGEMCVEAAVCYAMGLPHSDKPTCVAPSLRNLKISLNDKKWSSNAARARGLRRLAIAQLGSADHLDEKEFIRRVSELVIRKSVPSALRAVASMKGNAKHKDALLAAAERCEREGTPESVLKAKGAARAAYSAYDAYAAAAAAQAATYASAVSYAADAHAAAHAATDAHAARAAYSAADAAAAAAYTDAHAATDATDATDAYDATYDKSLADFAEAVVQILIDMKVPGTKWLDITEAG